ncbi:MAG: hypothetical protein ACXVCY_04160 [Pseudobdellovibrionaceae bacterium]
MGRSEIFNGVELTIPDAYSALDVSRLMVPNSAGVGIVALVGESEGGKPGLHMFPGGTSSNIVKKELIGGAGANMVRLALRAGVDDLVQAGASTVLFYKTNNSTQSQVLIGSQTNPVFTLVTKQYGKDTAKYIADCASVGPAKFLSVRDENGKPDTSLGVGEKSFFTITRSVAGGAIAATASLSYVGAVLKLTLKADLGAGVVTEAQIDCTGLKLKDLRTALLQYPNWTIDIPALADESLSVADMDMVLADVNCLAPTKAGFLASVYELIQWGQSQSQLVDVVRGQGNDVTGVPVFASKVFTGGTRGTTTNTDVQNALNQLLQMRVNIVVPLFSSSNQDGSSVDIAAVNSMVKDHVVNRSAILGRSEAYAYVSIKGNKDAFKAECARMGSRRVSVTSHWVKDLDIDGNVKTFDEYAFAVICAQTQAGSKIGTPLTNKLIPVIAIGQDVSWNPVENSVELIKAGALIAGADENNQIRIIAGYSSWTGDDNNANIFIETIESLDIFAFNHRKYMRAKFLGKTDFTTQDVIDAIKESCKAERDSTRSIKGFNMDQLVMKSTNAGKLVYDIAVEPFEGVIFVLPTVVAYRE